MRTAFAGFSVATCRCTLTVAGALNETSLDMRGVTPAGVRMSIVRVRSELSHWEGPEHFVRRCQDGEFLNE